MLLPKSATILFARQPTKFSAIWRGAAIDTCDATPARCPIAGLPVAAVTFELTLLYKPVIPAFDIGPNLLKVSFTIPLTRLLALPVMS